MKNNHPGSKRAVSPRTNQPTGQTTQTTQNAQNTQNTEAQPLRVFVENQITNGGRKWRMGAGLLLEFLLLAAVLAVPLYLTEQMDTKGDQADGTLIDVFLPPPEGDPTADPNQTHMGSSDAPVPIRERQPRFQLSDSPLLTYGDPKPVDDLLDADWDPAAGDAIPWGVPGGIGPGQGFFPGTGIGVPPPPSEPVQVGGDVRPPRLVHMVRPDYPRMAQQVGIEGDVVFIAVLGADGRVRQLSFVEGHPLLRKAARNAVIQWVYQPTHLNGYPVPVKMSITVKFHLRR